MDISLHFTKYLVNYVEMSKDISVESLPLNENSHCNSIENGNHKWLLWFSVITG